MPVANRKSFRQDEAQQKEAPKAPSQGESSLRPEPAKINEASAQKAAQQAAQQAAEQAAEQAAAEEASKRRVLKY